MPIEIDVIAIVLMESLAAAIFLITLVFIEQSMKIGNKLEALKESCLEEKSEEECWSYKWVTKNITMSRRSILHPGLFGGTFLMWGTFAIACSFAFIVIIALGAVGYTPLLVLVALAMISDPEAYQAYSYVNAVMKVSMDQLNKEDEDYMRIAKKALERKALRFLMIAITFAILGPFIPLIFDWLTFTLTVYVNILFKATETARNASIIFAMVIAIVLPVILLYLPELMGKTLLRKIRVAIRETRKHKKE